MSVVAIQPVNPRAALALWRFNSPRRWMIPILLLAFWLGARALSTNPFWGDEINSLRDADSDSLSLQSPADIWTEMARINPMHAPGYFVMLNAWAAGVGWSREALRLLTVLCGLAGIAWTYRLGADLLGPRVGLYGAAILATSMLYVHYLTKVRMYEMVALLGALTLCIYLRLIRRRRAPGPLLWLALFFGAVSLLYTHYIGALILIAIGLYHLLFVRRNRRWLQVVAVMALAGILFLPWLSVMLAGISEMAGEINVHIAALTADEVVLQLAYLFGNGYGFILIPPLLLAAYAPLRFATRREIRGSARLWFFFAAVLALILILNAATQIITDRRVRYLMPLWPLLALLVGFGLTQADRWRPRLGMALLAAWLTFGLAQSTGKLMSLDLDGFNYIFPVHNLVTLLHGKTQPDDLLLIYLPETDLDLTPKRYKALIGYYVAPTGLRSQVVQSQPPTLAVRDLSQQARIWFAYAPEKPPNRLDAYQAALRQSFQYCASLDQGIQLRAELYARTSAACDESTTG